jgi:hypothetical protein
MPKEDIEGKLYHSAASFGRFYAFITAIIASIVGLVFVVVGIVMIYNRGHRKSVIGKALSDSTEDDTQDTKGNTQIAYDTTVSYTVPGEDSRTFTRDINGSRRYSKSDPVMVWYETNDHGNVIADPNPTWAGWAMIGIAVFIVAMAWIWVWITRKYETVAAVGGAAEIVNLLTGR